MKILLKSEFTTKSGETGTIITRKRKDGLYITTFRPALGLNFHSMDANMRNSHETVKNFLRDVKGCSIKGDNRELPKPDPRKRFIL